LGPIGVLIAAILPEKLKGVEQRKLETGEMKKCPFCAELIKTEAKVCRYCGKELQMEEKA
jgi:predicted amidophosphoribosyltransferase